MSSKPPKLTGSNEHAFIIKVFPVYFPSYFEFIYIMESEILK